MMMSCDITIITPTPHDKTPPYPRPAMMNANISHHLPPQALVALIIPSTLERERNIPYTRRTTHISPPSHLIPTISTSRAYPQGT